MNGMELKFLTERLESALQKSGEWLPGGFLGKADQQLLNSVLASAKKLLPDNEIVQAMREVESGTMVREAYLQVTALYASLKLRF